MGGIRIGSSATKRIWQGIQGGEEDREEKRKIKMRSNSEEWSVIIKNKDTKGISPSTQHSSSSHIKRHKASL